MLSINKTHKQDQWQRYNRLAAAIVLLLTVIFVCTPYFYLQRNLERLSDRQVAAVIITPLLLMALVGFGGGSLWLRRLAALQTAAFKAAFAPFGMAGEPYLNSHGKRFSGLWHGRRVEIIFQQAQRFEWQLSTKLSGRWLISNTAPEDLTTVLLDPLLFAQKRIYAYGTFALKLASQETAVTLLNQLLLQDSPFTRRTLELHNGRLIYRQTEYDTPHEFRPTAAAIEQIMNDLLALLKHAEKLA